MSCQAVKKWKVGTDLELSVKMNRILDLYDHPPADRRMICVNELAIVDLAGGQIQCTEQVAYSLGASVGRA